MSRIAKYKTTIVVPPTQLESHQANIKASPCFEILQKALEKLARDRGGQLGRSYVDNAGEEHDCLVAVRTDDFPSGIGVNIESDGKVVFLYDAYGGRGETAKAICDEVTQNYAVIAVMRAQQRHGFRLQEPQVITKTQGIKHVKIVGVM